MRSNYISEIENLKMTYNMICVYVQHVFYY